MRPRAGRRRSHSHQPLGRAVVREGRQKRPSGETSRRRAPSPRRGAPAGSSATTWVEPSRRSSAVHAAPSQACGVRPSGAKGEPRAGRESRARRSPSGRRVTTSSTATAPSLIATATRRPSATRASRRAGRQRGRRAGLAGVEVDDRERRSRWTTALRPSVEAAPGTRGRRGGTVDGGNHRRARCPPRARRACDAAGGGEHPRTRRHAGEDADPGLAERDGRHLAGVERVAAEFVAIAVRTPRTRARRARRPPGTSAARLAGSAHGRAPPVRARRSRGARTPPSLPRGRSAPRCRRNSPGEPNSRSTTAPEATSTQRNPRLLPEGVLPSRDHATRSQWLMSGATHVAPSRKRDEAGRR